MSRPRAHLGGGAPNGYYEMEEEPTDTTHVESAASQAVPQPFPRRRHAVRLTTILLYLTLFSLATLDANVLPAIYSLITVDIPVPDTSELAVLRRLEMERLTVGAVAAVLTGVLVDCHSRHVAFAAAVVVGKVGSIGLYFAANFFQLQVGHALMGVTVGALLPLMGSLLSDLFPIGSRTKMVGFVLTAMAAGPVAGRFFGQWISGQWGWRLPFLLLSVPGIASALAMLLMAEPRRATQEEALGLDSRSGALWAYRRRLSLAKLAGVFSTPSFLLLLCQAVVVGPAVCALDALPTYLAADLRLSAATAAALNEILHLAGVAGLCLGGLLAQELSHHSRSGLPMLAAVSMVLTAGGSALVFQPTLMTNLQVLVVLVGCTGVVASLFLPSLYSMALCVNRPETRGIAMGLLLAVQASGQLIGSMLLALFISQTGGDRPRALLAASFCWGVSAVLLALAVHTFRRDEAALQAAMAQVFELELEMQEILAPGSTDNYDPAAQGRWPFGHVAYEDALAADIAAAAQAEFAAYVSQQAAAAAPEVPRSGSESSVVELGEQTKCDIPRTHSW